MNDRELDIKTLTQLNTDYLSSDQNNDVARYEEILADDFTASLPDFHLYSRKEFIELISKPRPFTDLTADEVQIRLLGDFALIHGHITFKTLKGETRQGRYTDDWQRRGEKWLCIAANVSAESTD